MNESSVRLKAAVVGAGFTGLVTAYYLERAGYSVEIYERSNRVGGLLHTTHSPYGISESAANAFLNSTRVEEIFKDLDIPLVKASRESRARFFFRDGRARGWPIGFSGTLQIICFVFRFFFTKAKVTPESGESIESWGRRALGDEATEYLLLPGLQGIYAGDGRRLSAKLLLGVLFRPGHGEKPVFRGSVSAQGGMGEFVEKLAEKLISRGVRIHLGREAPEVSGADITYYCGSAAQTSASLARIAPGLSQLLGKIEMLPLVSVTAFFPRESRVKPGFGVLFPPREEFESLGVLYNHWIFPKRVSDSGTASETWILGGARFPGVDLSSDDQILEMISRDRARLRHGRAEVPLHYLIHRWPKAIPYYTVEFESILEEVKQRKSEFPKIRVLGNFMGGIGLAKILDRVALEIRENEKR